MDQLTEIWTQADSELRKAITRANHALDKRLAANAENEGESRPNNRRITFEQPLAIFFRVESDGLVVTVLKVRLTRKRKK